MLVPPSNGDLDFGTVEWIEKLRKYYNRPHGKIIRYGLKVSGVPDYDWENHQMVGSHGSYSAILYNIYDDAGY